MKCLFNTLCKGYNSFLIIVYLSVITCMMSYYYTCPYQSYLDIVPGRKPLRYVQKMKFMNIKGFLQQRFTPPSHSQDFPRVLAETIFVVSQSVILFSSQSWFLLYLFRVE